MGFLLNFVYIFGRVACQDCQLTPRWCHFCPACLFPALHHFYLHCEYITYISIYIASISIGVLAISCTDPAQSSLVEGMSFTSKFAPMLAH